MLRRGRARRRFIVLAAAVLALSGCGADATPSGSETAVVVDDLQRQGFPEEDQCPATGDSFRTQNEAAYQVFGQIDYVDQETGKPAVFHLFIGTAWGVGERSLATNAHVTQAFVDSAEQGTQFSRAIAVQSGTGTVIRLLRALTHPDYSGDPLGSPDVGLFTTQEKLPAVLPLAPVDSVLDLGDEFQLTGFPGDVDDFIKVIPGETIPQATSLSGAITARRSHDPTAEVTGATLDYYQHQAPTTPGTSGSAIVSCGLVAAINNAGTVKMVVTPTPDGDFTIDRQAAASNNFGVHVRHIHEMVELFEANAVQGFELPVPAVIQQLQIEGGGNIGGGEEPESNGDTDTEQVTSFDFQGTVETEPVHGIYFTVSLDNGAIAGRSDWSGNVYDLTGQADLNTGEFTFWDNGPDIDPEYPVGFYFGFVNDDGTFDGYYAEDEVTTYPFSGALEE